MAAFMDRGWRRIGGKMAAGGNCDSLVLDM